MTKYCLLLTVFGTAAANFCTYGTGTWSFAIAEGVTDFAYGGAKLNNSNNCFEGCLATGTAVQNFKVAMSGIGPNTTVQGRKLGSKAERVAQLMKIRDDDDDPNTHNCLDPVLRDDIKNALNKVTDHSCKGIVKALLFNLNRPGWAVNCVNFEATSIDGIVQDMNFCAYIGVVAQDVFDIRLGKIDTS